MLRLGLKETNESSCDVVMWKICQIIMIFINVEDVRDTACLKAHGFLKHFINDSAIKESKMS